MPPQFFYFDKGNVLLSFDYEVAARNMAAVCGATPAVCRQAAFESDLLPRFESGRISADEFHQQFSQATGTTSDRDALLRAHSQMFSLMHSTARILVQLKGVRRRIGLLSNTCIDHHEYCRERFTVIRELFDVYVLSYEIGVMKPDPAIFAAAIDRAGVAAEHIFYADDRQENVAAAREAGMDAVLFTDANQLLDDLRTRGVELNI